LRKEGTEVQGNSMQLSFNDVAQPTPNNVIVQVRFPPTVALTPVVARILGKDKEQPPKA